MVEKDLPKRLTAAGWMGEVGEHPSSRVAVPGEVVAIRAISAEFVLSMVRLVL